MSGRYPKDQLRFAVIGQSLSQLVHDQLVQMELNNAFQ
jgi:hypothetical protein